MPTICYSERITPKSRKGDKIMTKKTYNFTTDSGKHVTVNTISGTEDYFEVYITIPELDIKDQEVYNISVDRISFTSMKLHRPCAVLLPEEIGKSIKDDMVAACSDTGMIIVATLKYKDGTMRQFFGNAIAEMSIIRNTFSMPDNMMSMIKDYSYDGKIYDFGGIEDDCDSHDKPMIYGDKINRFWMPSIEYTDDWNAFDALTDPDKVTKRGEDIEIEITVVNPIK